MVHEGLMGMMFSSTSRSLVDSHSDKSKNIPKTFLKFKFGYIASIDLNQIGKFGNILCLSMVGVCVCVCVCVCVTLCSAVWTSCVPSFPTETQPVCPVLCVNRLDRLSNSCDHWGPSSSKVLDIPYLSRLCWGGSVYVQRMVLLFIAGLEFGGCNSLLPWLHFNCIWKDGSWFCLYWVCMCHVNMGVCDGERRNVCVCLCVCVCMLVY